MPAVVTRCVVVLLLLLPVKLVSLPLNMSLVDVWAALTLPMCWVVLARGPHPVTLPYLPAFLMILLATALASLLSTDPDTGLVVMLQDSYLYVWMVTLAAVFACSDERQQRLLLTAWCAAACVNAALILAQFVHPPLLAMMKAAAPGMDAGQASTRPSGLMANSNAAATFQVFGFLPLALLGLRPRLLVPIALLCAAALLCTGSMGAAVALSGGVACGLVVLLLFSADMPTVAAVAWRATVAVVLCATCIALLWLGGSELTARLESLSWGRADRSATGRFDLWERGLDTLMAEIPLVGIGPDRFRQREGSELHNDLLGFSVERGLLGLLGLLVFVAMAVTRSLQAFGVERAHGRLRGAAFPAAVAAAALASLTHEVFHSRAIWLVLAVQEAWLHRARRGPTT